MFCVKTSIFTFKRKFFYKHKNLDASTNQFIFNNKQEAIKDGKSCLNGLKRFDLKCKWKVFFL